MLTRTFRSFLSSIEINLEDEILFCMHVATDVNTRFISGELRRSA